MEKKNVLDKIQPTDLNCSVFSVYDYKGLSLQELLSVFYTKINECVDVVNAYDDFLSLGIDKAVADVLAKWLADGTFNDIINNEVFGELSDKVDKAVLNTDRVNVLSYYEDADGNDYSIAINKAIADNKRVFIPPGDYHIYDTIWLDNDTNILMDSETVLIRMKTTPGKMFDTVSTPSTTSYNGVTRVVIDGGKIKHDGVNIDVSLMTLFHAKNVTIKNVEFINTYGSHCIDVVGCNNVIIDNCYFNGFVVCSRKYAEMIQIDVAYANATGYDVEKYPPGSACYDGTISKNIYVTNNIARGVLNFIGTHTQVNGKKCANVFILNNDLQGIGKRDNYGYGVRLECIKNVLIQGNVFNGFFKDVGADIVSKVYSNNGGVLPFVPGEYMGAENVSIVNNVSSIAKSDTSSHNIDFNHSNAALQIGVAYHRDIVIENNFFTNPNPSSVLKLETTKGFKINNNTFRGGSSPCYIDYDYVSENGDGQESFNGDMTVGNWWSSKTYQLSIERYINGGGTRWEQSIVDTPGEQGVLAFKMYRNGTEINRFDMGDTYFRPENNAACNLGTSSRRWKGIYLSNAARQDLTEHDKGYVCMVDNVLCVWDGQVYRDVLGGVKNV